MCAKISLSISLSQFRIRNQILLYKPSKSNFPCKSLLHPLLVIGPNLPCSAHFSLSAYSPHVPARRESSLSLSLRSRCLFIFACSLTPRVASWPTRRARQYVSARRRASHPPFCHHHWRHLPGPALCRIHKKKGSSSHSSPPPPPPSPFSPIWQGTKLLSLGCN